jgi:UDP-N-acetylmuramoyl-L-alanyl-D-glutamate--2,6-diaminopimelate ligase
MRLKTLLEKLEYTVVRGNDDIEISEVVYDSRKLSKDCLFVCIIGANFDAHSAVGEAVSTHAACVIVSKDVDVPDDSDMTVIKVDDTRYAMAFIAAAVNGHPADRLTTIGITGTKGKTTVTYMIKGILEQAGHKVGLIGTIETIIGDEHIPSKNTTPDSYVIQEYFARMVKEGCDIVVMEVSSQGLMQHRTQGFIFDYGIFTNIKPDHIGPNEHKDFEDYLHCKGMLFKQCRTGIVNGDDEHWKDVTEGHTCKLLTYGLSEGCDYRASDMRYTRGEGYIGVNFSVSGRVDMDVEVSTPGIFSVYNALTAVAVCHQFGSSEKEVRNALKAVTVKGRIELINVSDDFTLMIDHAHNAMALESLLTTLKEYNPHRLIAVFGCGGNRDRNRRFEMGEVSGKLADFTIITTDNPRFEDPLDIIADIVTGIEKTEGNYITIADRKEAIRYAITHGQPGDIIVLAGKGHEDYQEIKGVKYPMDERVLISEVLEEIR